MQAFGEPDEIRLAELLPCFDRYVCQNGKSRLKEPLADCFCLLAIARPEFLADVQGEENGSAGSCPSRQRVALAKVTGRRKIPSRYTLATSWALMPNQVMMKPMM